MTSTETFSKYDWSTRWYRSLHCDSPPFYFYASPICEKPRGSHHPTSPLTSARVKISGRTMDELIIFVYLICVFDITARVRHYLSTYFYCNSTSEHFISCQCHLYPLPSTRLTVFNKFIKLFFLSVDHSATTLR